MDAITFMFDGIIVIFQNIFAYLLWVKSGSVASYRHQRPDFRHADASFPFSITFRWCWLNYCWTVLSSVFYYFLLKVFLWWSYVIKWGLYLWCVQVSVRTTIRIITDHLPPFLMVPVFFCECYEVLLPLKKLWLRVIIQLGVYLWGVSCRKSHWTSLAGP